MPLNFFSIPHTRRNFESFAPFPLFLTWFYLGFYKVLKTFLRGF